MLNISTANRTIGRLLAVAVGMTSGMAATPATSAPAAKIVRIEIKGFKFVPAQVEAHVGDIIEFANADFAPHTATADNRSWDTKSLKNGATTRIMVGKAGIKTFHCTFHPQMKGIIVVK